VRRHCVALRCHCVKCDLYVCVRRVPYAVATASSSLRSHCLVTASLLRRHCVVTALSLCCHCVVTASSLCRHCVVTASSLPCHCVAATASLLRCRCVVTVLSLRRHCIVTVLSLRRHYIVTVITVSSLRKVRFMRLSLRLHCVVTASSLLVTALSLRRRHCVATASSLRRDARTPTAGSSSALCRRRRCPRVSLSLRHGFDSRAAVRLEPWQRGRDHRSRGTEEASLFFIIGFYCPTRCVTLRYVLHADHPSHPRLRIFILFIYIFLL